MSEPRKPRPGDRILDRYVPNLAPEEREEARARLFGFVSWQVRILARQVREELDDSHDRKAQDTLDSIKPPS
jgi:hypothetical protein